MTHTPYRILTCADANFFHFLPTLEANIFQKTGEYPIIYDLGLTARQRAKLKSDVIKIDPPEGFDRKITDGAIRAHHKPDCIIDYFTRYQKPVLYIDADVFMIDTLPLDAFADCDIAVTPRHPKEMTLPAPFRNGKLNSGVWYLVDNARTRNLLLDWREICSQGVHTDQMALSQLIEDADLMAGFGLADVNGLKVLKLDPRIFNDVSCRVGCLWHFKNAGRKLHKKRRWFIAALCVRFAPHWFSKRVGKRRAEILYDTPELSLIR